MENKRRFNPSVWNNRTRLEKCLIASFAVLSIFCLLLVILLGTTATDCDEICTEPICVRRANEILNYINESVDLCEDFHRFTCGNLANAAGPYYDRDNAVATVAMDKLIESDIRRRIKDIVEEPIEPTDPKYLVAVKVFYRSCMNESAIESASMNRMKGILKDIGGWPLLDGHNWRETDFDWSTAVRKLRKMGVNYEPFFDTNVVIDDGNTDKFILNIQPPVIARHVESGSYRDYVVEIAKLFDIPHYRVVTEVDNFLKFQQLLREIIGQSSANAYNSMTVLRLHQRYPTIKWHDYVSAILYPVSQINMDDVVTVAEPDYLARLDDLLQRTPKRVLANFISWNVVLRLTRFLNRRVRETAGDYEFDAGLVDAAEDGAQRWEECVAVVGESLKIPVSATYIKKYSSEADRISVEEIIKLIKSQFENVIKSLDWMDENSKGTALAKLSNVAAYVSGNGSVGLDENELLLNEIYDAVEIHEGKYLASALNIDFLNANLRYQKLDRPVNESLWLTMADRALDLDVRYDVKLNSLFVPVTILDGIYFKRNRPMYLNYGTLGYSIAREISRVLVEGKSYDENGNFKDWWSPSTYINFNNKAFCIAEQVQNFTADNLIDGENINLTPDEIIAELAGSKVAYESYKVLSYLNGREPSLPGIKYSNEQLYWISLMLSKCSRTITTRSKSNMVETMRSHNKNNILENKLRVFTLLMNLEDFTEDFHCSADSHRNHDNEKCTVW